MDNVMEGTLEKALIEAIDICWNVLSLDNIEEHGGIILKMKDEDFFEYIPMVNDNKGTGIAPVLFTVNRDQYAETILPMFANGWRNYASFHTHPMFSPTPSNIDMTQLFTGFRINYIFSGMTGELVKYEWIDPKDTTLGVSVELVEI